jgi:hypothetical protein
VPDSAATIEAPVNQSSPEQPADTVARLRATFDTGRARPFSHRKAVPEKPLSA